MSLQNQDHLTRSVRCRSAFGRHAQIVIGVLSLLSGLEPLCSGQGVASAQRIGEPQDTSRLDVQYILKNTAVTLHEPVILSFIVRNTLPTPITLTLGIDNVQFFQFSLTLPGGTTIYSTPPRTEGFFSGTGTVTIQPKESYRQELLLNQWFRLDATGDYILTAKLTTRIQGEEVQLLGRTGTLHLTVEPRDAARLQEVCDELAKSVVNSPDAKSAYIPAFWLSYVTDPIAVPYLREVLFAQKLVEPSAIAGLERIGSTDAAKVLLSALDYQFGDTAILARGALGRIQGQISDPDLRSQISQALSDKRSPNKP